MRLNSVYLMKLTARWWKLVLRWLIVVAQSGTVIWLVYVLAKNMVTVFTVRGILNKD